MTNSQRDSREQAFPRCASSTAQWMAVYSKTNHEKTVAAELGLRGFEVFLPTYLETHVWSDRKKKLELPLFPNYLFVRAESRERVGILRCPGVLGIVSNGTADASIAEVEIEGIRRVLGFGRNVSPSPVLQRGERVLLEAGPMKGLEGTVIRHRGTARLVVSVSMLDRALSVDVEMAWIRTCDSTLSPALKSLAQDLKAAKANAFAPRPEGAADSEFAFPLPLSQRARP